MISTTNPISLNVGEALSFRVCLRRLSSGLPFNVNGYTKIFAVFSTHTGVPVGSVECTRSDSMWTSGYVDVLVDARTVTGKAGSYDCSLSLESLTDRRYFKIVRIDVSNTSVRLPVVIPGVAVIKTSVEPTDMTEFGYPIEVGSPILYRSDSSLYPLSVGQIPLGSKIGLCGKTALSGDGTFAIKSGYIERTDWTPVAGQAQLSANAQYFLTNTPGVISTTPTESNPAVGVSSADGRRLVLL